MQNQEKYIHSVLFEDILGNLIFLDIHKDFVLNSYDTKDIKKDQWGLAYMPLLPSPLKLQNFTTPNKPKWVCVCVWRFGVSFTYVIESIDSKLISVCLIKDYSLIAALHIFVYGSAECATISLECTKVKLLILDIFGSKGECLYLSSQTIQQNCNSTN